MTISSASDPLCDEPAEGSAVLDDDGDRWTRIGDHWHRDSSRINVSARWLLLAAVHGPLTLAPDLGRLEQEAPAEPEPYLPQAGHRVRYTEVREGVVTALNGMGYVLLNNTWYPSPRSTVRRGTWERLPDPEPTWQPRDAVRAADGQVYVRSIMPDAWLEPGSYNGVLDRDVPRPLTRLVPAP